MILTTFLQKNYDIDTVSSQFYRLINVWDSWYRANVSKFHSYSVYNGKRNIKCRRKSLCMAGTVCKDIADLLLNEKVEFAIDHKPTNDFVLEVLKQNQWQYKANEYQEIKAALGTVAYVVQLDNVVANEDGTIIPVGGSIKINYVSANNIYPVTWNNGVITECAFVFDKVFRGKKYKHIQIHRIVDGFYEIDNHVVREEGAGTEVPEEEWREMKPFQNMSAVVMTGSDKPQFVIDRLNIANKDDGDDGNPMGVALFHDSIDVLASLDLKYDSCANEFSLGKKRMFVAPEFLEDKNGNAVFDENDTIFYILPEDGLAPNESMHEVDMNLRVDEHSKAITDDLNLLSMKCGFGMNRYRFESGSIQTATQVVSENSDMFRTIQKHELKLGSVLEELFRIIARLGVVIGLPLDPEAEITINFDDSIIEDKEAERTSDRADVAMGAMPLYEYRAKWYGETEEEAKKMVVENTEVIE